MFAEVQPVAVLNRGNDTQEERDDARRVLKLTGCQYVRFEPRPGGGIAALGFMAEATNVERL